ncbi:MAG: hypothetical protein ACM31C_19075 [Acidobacteriota bacterium]
MDREAEARAIVERARAARRPTPRWLWTAAIVVSLVCVGSLVIGYLLGGRTSEAPRIGRPVADVSGGLGGFGIGLVVGIAVGIALGSVIALRRRD